MEYITSPNSFRVKGILIHVHPLEKDYPEDPATVEVEECIINHEDGGSVNVGSPTKTWFDEWYDELYNASHLHDESDSDSDEEVGEPSEDLRFNRPPDTVDEEVEEPPEDLEFIQPSDIVGEL